MKCSYLLIALGIAVAAAGLYFYTQTPPVTETQDEAGTPPAVSPALTTYEMAALGLSFQYQTGPDGYTLYERSVTDEPAFHVASLMLVHENERAMMDNPPAYTEGPMNIAVDVFTNEEMQFPLVWAREHGTYSNIELAQGEVAEAVVGGANALRYRVDGLYQMDVVVVAHGSKVYVLSASYLDAESPTYQDFDALLSSLRFVPELGQL